MTTFRTKIIVNPNSGHKDALQSERDIDRHLDKSRFKHDIVESKYRGHTSELAKEAVENNYDLVIAVGGDGTVNEIGSVLTDTETAMAILPKGSGNGVARCLQIPVKFKKAIEHLNYSATFQRIDTALLNNRPFIGLAGIGFDGLISHEFDRYASRGLTGYLRAVSKHFLKFRPAKFKVTADDEQLEVKGFLAVIANSDQFGNNARIAPKANMQDGLLNLVIVKDAPKITLLTAVLRLFGKSFDKSKNAVTLKGQYFKIETTFHHAHLDGEPIEAESPVEVKIKPASLKMFV